MTTKKNLNFFTDGACNNQHSGGWCFFCKELNIVVCDQLKDTTNNFMELKAIGSVLKFLLLSKIQNYEIIIHSDSAWSIGAITENWNLKTHVDYVNNLKKVINFLKINNKIKFQKVKGHNKLAENELCDSFAVIMSNL